MNLTFFIGAGFSKEFGYPVMSDFFKHADTSELLTKEDRGFLNDLKLNARKAAAFLVSNPTNLEDILSFSEMSARLSSSQESKAQRDRLLSILAKIYVKYSDVKEYWDRYKKFDKMLNGTFKSQAHSLSFITTNYDLNIESLCLSFNLNTSIGIEYDLINDSNAVIKNRFYSNSGIPLYKLHGSVNWFIGNESELLIEDRVVQVHGPLSDKDDKTYPLPLQCSCRYEFPSIPTLIPPSFLKPELPNFLQQVWKKAATALAEAHIVIFIGYSFPQADTEMRYFLATALSENANLRDIYIVDPRASAIAERLRNGQIKIGDHFNQFMQTINTEWVNASLDIFK